MCHSGGLRIISQHRAAASGTFLSVCCQQGRGGNTWCIRLQCGRACTAVPPAGEHMHPPTVLNFSSCVCACSMVYVLVLCLLWLHMAHTYYHMHAGGDCASSTTSPCMFVALAVTLTCCKPCANIDTLWFSCSICLWIRLDLGQSCHDAHTHCSQLSQQFAAI